MLPQVSPLAAHIHPFVLSDKGIVNLIEKEILKINPAPNKNQFQPATLDVRIGTVKVYDQEAWRKGVEKFNQQNDLNYEPSIEFAKVFPDEADIPIIIPPNSFVEMEFHEKLHFDTDNYYFTAELRSSRGRLALQSMDDLMPKFDNNLSFWNNNTNPIILYGQSKFAQLFFHPRNDKLPRDGTILNDPSEVRSIAQQVCGEDAMTIGPYIVFTLGDKMFQFKKNIGAIDTNKKRPDEEVYYTIPTQNRFIVEKNEAYIAQLFPKVDVPSNIGIRLLHSTPYDQAMIMNSSFQGFALDNSAVNAGWVDPGYQGKITAHPYRRIVPKTFQKGDPIALGVIYKYADSVDRSYGSKDLGSHYQNSDGTTSKN